MNIAWKLAIATGFVIGSQLLSQSIKYAASFGLTPGVPYAVSIVMAMMAVGIVVRNARQLLYPKLLSLLCAMHTLMVLVAGYARYKMAILDLLAATPAAS